MGSLDDVRRALADIVGGSHVVDDPISLAASARDHSFVPPLQPSFIVRPANETEVREIVLWANAGGTALVPVSSGPPHSCGDTVPTAPGAVVLDLSRMNAIRRIDRRNRLAVIEPGVTYAQMGAALADEGLAMVRPLLPRANKSVIGSLLERQPTLVPRYHYAFPEPLRDCGVVWGDGEFTYTGEAGYGPRSLETQWADGLRQVDPKGPAQTDFVRLLSGAQGTLGVVTWASIKCTLLPDVRKLFFVQSPRLEDLLGVCARLQRIRLGEEVFLANRALLASLLGAAPAMQAVATSETGSLPPWTLVVGIAGRALFPGERLAVQEADLTAVVRELGGASGLGLTQPLPGSALEHMLDVLAGVSDEPYWRFAEKGDSRDVFFQCTLDSVPSLVAGGLTLAEECAYAGDVGIYIQPQQQGVVHHCEFMLPFDPDDVDETAAVRAFHADAPAQLMAQGAYFSRPYGAWADLVYDRDESSRALLKTVKRVFDPNNVLNPGKLCF